MASLPKACVDAANVWAVGALPDFGLSYSGDDEGIIDYFLLCPYY